MGCSLAVEGVRPAACDDESREWIEQLEGDRRARQAALERLHALLLKMAYTRLLSWSGRLGPEGVDELAMEAADAATVRVLGHLDDFRGASRFTTWACQFVINEVSVALRRYRRQRREIPVEPEVLVLLGGSGRSIERELEDLELLQAISLAVRDVLTSRQREVMLALAIAGDSPQALAASLHTSRGALYKTLHDARRRLRDQLEEQELIAADDASGKKSHSDDSNSSRVMKEVSR